MSGCGYSACMGHGHYEVCGEEGQLGIYECNGCIVKRLTAALEKIAEIPAMESGLKQQTEAMRALRRGDES